MKETYIISWTDEDKTRKAEIVDVEADSPFGLDMAAIRRIPITAVTRGKDEAEVWPVGSREGKRLMARHGL